MGWAQMPPRRGVTLARISVVSVVLFVILFSARYYLPAVHDGLRLDVYSKPPSSVSPPEDTEPEDVDILAEPSDDSPPKSATCRSLPGAEDVLLVLKTGATELYRKLPEQLLTLTQCAPNLMIFSDLEQDIGDYHVYDALDQVSDEYKESQKEFEFYRKLQQYHAAHQDLSLLKSQDGWDLDKWKFIPMLHKVYREHPTSKWFVFVEADTFLSWTNLLQLLDHLDPSEPLYAGAVFGYGDTAFAQGGTGYFMSNAALKAFERTSDVEHIAKWDQDTTTCCCGDVIVGEALKDSGVNVTGAWPLLQPESPLLLEWSEGMWCRPAVTWHHMDPFEVEALWSFEQAWVEKTGGHGEARRTPYLYKDVFEHVVQPSISHTRTDWNNLSRDRTFTKPADDHPREFTNWDDLEDEEKERMWEELSDIEKESIESAEACLAACDADEECLQYYFRPGTCRLNRSVRLGASVESKKEGIKKEDGKVEENAVSGWMLDRIEKFKERQPPCVPSWKIDDH